MKKLFLLIIPFLFISTVNAQIDTETNYIFPIENELNQKPNQVAIDYIYNTLIPSYTNKDYIVVYMPFATENIYVIFYEENNEDYLYLWGDEIPQLEYHINNDSTECSITNSVTYTVDCTINSGYRTIDLLRTRNVGNDTYNWYGYYDSSFTINSLNNFEMTSFYQDNIVVEENQSMPKLKDLYNYTSFAEYQQNHLTGYTTVNLDNYEYVLLSLKNYNQSEPFQTNFYVQGQIGITPIYNYGQTSKDSVTGSQVQDRCNVEYTNYTEYPLYILQSDLQNNAIYAVKSCLSGSSFKFDSSVFDITYVTQSNLSNPTITINGNTYDTIPYADLPSTATENEENNYIPGQSGSANSTGGLDSAIKSTQQKMSEIWNTFTYFTDFINQLFSTLPSELRVILVSAFTISIVLGLIKIFVL